MKKNKENQLNFLEKLVNVNSGTENIAGVQEVGELLRPQFEKLGFKTHWENEPEDMHRAGTLIAEHPGNSGKRLLLSGHLDTVFSQSNGFTTFKRQGEKAIGPGVIDDKGGDVVLLFALQALADIDALKDATITVVLTGDEEDSGKPAAISRKPLMEAAKKSDVALDFEWSYTKDSITVSRRGICTWLLESTGKEAHSSEIFLKDAGYGAVFESARIMNEIRNTLSKEKFLSINPGVMVAGTKINLAHTQGTAEGKTNVIASHADVRGDLRFLTPAQKKKVEKKLSIITMQSLPDTKSKITFQDGIPAMVPTANNMKLLQLYSSVSNNLGYGIVRALDPGKRGAGDISYIAGIVPYNLAGLGPQGSGAHSEQETLDVSSLGQQTERAAILIYRLTHGKAVQGL